MMLLYDDIRRYSWMTKEMISLGYHDIIHEVIRPNDRRMIYIAIAIRGC